MQHSSSCPASRVLIWRVRGGVEGGHVLWSEGHVLTMSCLRSSACLWSCWCRRASRSSCAFCSACTPTQHPEHPPCPELHVSARVQ